MFVKTMELVKASMENLEVIHKIYLECREELFKNGILQWDDLYPNKEYFQECIEDGCLYVLKRENEILGHVVLNEWESKEWEQINWCGTSPLILHSLIITPQVQGRGLGTHIVKQCEELAANKGYKSIRLDAFSGNEKAIQLYKKLGYHVRGSVFFTSKPEGHQEYICLEKVFCE